MSCPETTVNLRYSSIGLSTWHGQTVNDELAAQYTYGPATRRHSTPTRGAVPDWARVILSTVVGMCVRDQPGAST